MAQEKAPSWILVARIASPALGTCPAGALRRWYDRPILSALARWYDPLRAWGALTNFRLLRDLPRDEHT